MSWLKTFMSLIVDTSKLVEKIDYDNEISDIEDEIPTITGLATTTSLTAVKKNTHH